jgi:uncharacterized protein (DUF1330 family)
MERGQRVRKKMAAYVIAQINAINAERYPEYTAQVPATIAKYGGRFIARGGNAEVLEGSLSLPQRLVIIEFPSREAAKAWWSSEEYGPLKALRQEISDGTLFLVDGV